ncbi:MAG: DNA protecting protein DprA [Candidatus Doudnabacteria bacterium RIFCSPLOWO2_01_FULL_44_21]|uniref:DNA protecting protein DprA n=1 Tax=Candidatus Doudnabacteria bacterium RIFCSPLOWO2_01_FULL_44_21 TaxID=1817841 RepID=A0A1F5Q2J5_9BACT|nr:MAG: DNA protecting protein DprA [Candidatus Doudnabacteria bacterium RIFCSPHIGHO2_02_FULL_43_13b]OGE96393.1 MAG: DNA protecting protein DprA [Candidatus Doudnabacteria bacterium RIFCSPLOWO2_01_FULL_44_21]
MHLLEAKIFANALNLIPQFGPVRLARLLEHFGSWQKAWAAHPRLYIKAGVSDKIIDQIIARKDKINPEQSFAALSRLKIEVVLEVENAYPQLLKEITASPPLLYVRGNKELLNSTTVAVVGTRKISLYGKQVCEELGSGLALNNITVVSGLAFGVDAEILNSTVKNEGMGIAVLATDLDNSSISPRSNFQLSQKIAATGCLVSEYPLGADVQKQNFPIRNRIIAGLSLATVVVEADIESGALITANFALEQNREVFAVPGSIFSQVSRGTNELIRKGAHVAGSVANILEELNLSAEVTAEPIMSAVSAEERLVLDRLSREPVHLEDLIRSVKLSAAVANATLTMLEMKGRVKNLGGGKYIKIR